MHGSPQAHLRFENLFVVGIFRVDCALRLRNEAALLVLAVSISAWQTSCVQKWSAIRDFPLTAVTGANLVIEL